MIKQGFFKNKTETVLFLKKAVTAVYIIENAKKCEHKGIFS
ncbi:hypothetical protein CHK_2665 [Christensenella hongkongensis]|uniref:Uncharacterized protein n=1 Tax=Christensenella hongkongensis TaxID=270498 RepID=A0A0M2NHF1_9FIRM|nr:hypothetical protein CHK_2665 [Christensenella hongkongensis]